VRLDPEPRELLRHAKIGMLAVKGRLPLVSPAAFHFGGDAIWMTTSRHAVKLVLARRDPRAAFLVASGSRRGASGVLLQGMLETYDPRSPRDDLRAVMQGPSIGLNLAGYALKNAAFIGGYVLDLARIPAEWWPQNRVLLRLKPDRVSLLPPLPVPPARPERVSSVPGQVAHAVSRHREAQLCWVMAGLPVLASAAWTLDGPDLLAWLPGSVPRPPRSGASAAVVIEHHHPFRATRMLGLCLRGKLGLEPDAKATIAQRYGGDLPEDGWVLRLQVARVTWWRGFEVRSRGAGEHASDAAGDSVRGSLSATVAGPAIPEAGIR